MIKILSIKIGKKTFKVGDIACSKCLYAGNEHGVRPMKIEYIDIDYNKYRLPRFCNGGVCFATSENVMKYNKSTFKKLSKDPNFISKYEE